ncbi:hypothetical protein [Brevibacillus laterosporus]|nr:hypothetical protein [Brevibacillus laterosporus]MCG7320034.1 hypothetical protein [Brevibacillus laterosporus]
MIEELEISSAANSNLSNIVNGTIPKLETASDIAQALEMKVEGIWIFE